MKTAEFTDEEAKEILYWIEARIPNCEGVLSEHYTAHFLADHLTEAEIAEVHAERRAELKMLNNIVRKLK